MTNWNSATPKQMLYLAALVARAKRIDPDNPPMPGLIDLRRSWLKKEATDAIDAILRAIAARTTAPTAAGTTVSAPKSEVAKLVERPTIPNVGTPIVFTDPSGETLEGIVTERRTSPPTIVLAFDDDTAEFELGATGRWYDINDGQTPWTLSPAAATVPSAEVHDAARADIRVRIAAYVAEAQRVMNEHYAKAYPSLTADTLMAEFISPKWCRVVSGGDGRRSVHSFVALVSSATKGLGDVRAGDIHKAAGWKAPAKHARGSVFTADFGRCLTWCGVAYLRS